MVSSIGSPSPQISWMPSKSKPQTGFIDSLRSAVQEVDAIQQDADERVSNLLQGNGEDVHTAMMAVERAQLSFELMMQLRNKVVAAYQEVARMQF